jgi:hypothetical protein
MIQIIKKCFENLQLKGFDFDYIIGSNEQLSFQQAYKAMFYFGFLNYELDAKTKQKLYTIDYVLALETNQNTNDIDSLISIINNITLLNEAFIDELRKYKTDLNSQILEFDTTDLRVEEFYDMHAENPTTGIKVNLRIKKIATNKCEWKNLIQ